jgi:hypothetical protein
MGTKTQEVSGASGTARGGTATLSGPGVLFGVPMGDLGLFASLLMGAAAGFAAFFAATFVGIVGILLYNSAGHNADYAYSYLRLGLPVGVLVLVVSMGYLGMLWVRRQMRKG